MYSTLHVTDFLSPWISNLQNHDLRPPSYILQSSVSYVTWTLHFILFTCVCLYGPCHPNMRIIHRHSFWPHFKEIFWACLFWIEYLDPLMMCTNNRMQVHLDITLENWYFFCGFWVLGPVTLQWYVVIVEGLYGNGCWWWIRFIKGQWRGWLHMLNQGGFSLFPSST